MTRRKTDPAHASIICLTLALLAGMTVCGIGTGASPGPRVDRGVIDCSAGDAATLSRGIKLDGGWEFYWKKLLLPADFAAADRPRPDAIVECPGYWNGVSVAGRPLPATGFATYRATVFLPQGLRSQLALDIMEIGTAYRVYADGLLVGGRGAVSATPERGEPHLFPEACFFTPAGDRVEIVIHVSNYHYRMAGIWQGIVLQEVRAFIDANSRHTMTEAALAGILFVMFMYHLAVFVMNRGERPLLYFALVCACVGLRQLVVGHKTILLLAPLPWEVYLRVEYFTLGAGVPLVAAYLRSIIGEEFSGIYFRVLVGLFAVFAAIVLLTPSRIYTETAIAYEANYIAFMAYASFIVARRALRGSRDERYIFWPGLFLAATVVNDILLANGVVHTTNLIPLGMTVFVILQAFLLARRYVDALDRSRRLAGELGVKNEETQKINTELVRLKVNLEKMVRERTAELDAAAKRAESASRAKSAFLANMSHELRTPLNAILGFTQILEKGNMPNGAEYLRYIRNGGEHLLALVNEILDFSKIEANKIAISRAVVDPRAVMAACLNAIAPLAAEKGVRVSVLPDEKPSMIVADEMRLKEVFLNLLSNAVKFTNAGRGIGATVRDAGDAVEISVWDRGIGISHADIDRIFNPFEQVETRLNGRPPGTGLGLSITKKLVELMQGTLSVSVNEGGGTVFTMRFPAAGSGLQAGAVAACARQVSHDREERVTGKLLVIEDNEMNRKLIKSIFAMKNVDADFRETGEEGITAVMHADYALILMDIQLPGIDGITALREMKKLLGNRMPPSIALTAYAVEGDRESLLAEGFDEYVSKPFNIDELMSVIAQVAGNGRGPGR